MRSTRVIDRVIAILAEGTARRCPRAMLARNPSSAICAIDRVVQHA